MKNLKVKVRVKVVGKNVEYLPEILRRREINVYSVKNISKNQAVFVVDLSDLRKFFAILKNMCYNTKVVGYTGLFAPIVYAIKNLGLTIGVLLFCVITFVMDNVVFKIDVVGSGKPIQNEIISVVKDCGVGVGSLFSKCNYANLSNEILKSNDKLKFVSVYKNGNRLTVQTVMGDDVVDVKNPICSDVVCDKEGVVESVKVLRGTALVNVGDKVGVDTALIGAFTTFGEDEKYPSTAVGVVTVISEEKYFYKTQIFSTAIEDFAKQKAKFLCSGEVVGCDLIKVSGGYEVTLKVRTVYYGG